MLRGVFVAKMRLGNDKDNNNTRTHTSRETQVGLDTDTQLWPLPHCFLLPDEVFYCDQT